MAVKTLTKRHTRKTSKTTKATTRKSERKATPASKLFQGTIPCTRLFKLDLSEAFAAKQKWKKGTRVEVANWMIINDAANTVTYCNTYHGIPRASYNPETYTYPMEGWSLKQATKKMDTFTEIEDREEWPAWVVPATKRSRK